MSAYQFLPATVEEVPILISVPHCGIEFPEELKNEYVQELIQAPDDTDWFVDHLYDFAPHLGISMIIARYSRWVIDLNRDPKNEPLYTDGRLLTRLCPTTTFLGKSIYRDQRKEVSSHEVERRRSQYYRTYHGKIEEQLHRLKRKFGTVLLWDCHSIRQVVRTIHPEKFPDLILGDADGTSASPGLIEAALRNLELSDYTVGHNYPFKGGYITRHFGKPGEHQHALQLEMCKVRYMDDGELKYDSERAGKMRTVLQSTLTGLIEWLTN